MKRWFILSAILLCSFTSLSQQEHSKILRQRTEQRLRALADRTKGVLGLCAVDLTAGERFSINEQLVFPQGSAIKVPVLMEVYKQASEGKLKLTDLRWVEKTDRVGGSGILSDFGEHTSQLSIRDLCVLMIVLSDNTAANMLIRLVGMENVNSTLSSLGLKQTRLQRVMLDRQAMARDEENLSSPAEAARILEMLHRGKFVSRAVCDEILSILTKPQPVPTCIGSGLPAGVPLAMKPGWIDGTRAEWAIVYLKNRPYIVVIMENYELDDEARTVMTEISKTLYDYFSRLGRASKYGIYLDRPAA